MKIGHRGAAIAAALAAVLLSVGLAASGLVDEWRAMNAGLPSGGGAPARLLVWRGPYRAHPARLSADRAKEGRGVKVIQT